MLKPADELAAKIERKILSKIFVFLTIATVVCLTVGIGIGLLISSNKTSANEPNNLNVPESMSISFSEVAKKVEPAVVNIDTKSKVPDEVLKKIKSLESSL